MKGKASIAIGALFALAVTCYLCGVVVPEASTGVRLVLGHPTDEPIVAGVHWELPRVYNIVQFSGSIHREQYGGQGDERACAARLPGPFVLLWQVVDARRFYPLALAAPGKTDTQVSQPLMETALCAELQSRPLARWDSSAMQALYLRVNQRLLPGGMRLLAIQPRQP